MTRPTQHPAGNSESRKRALTVVPCCDAAAKVERVEALIEDERAAKKIAADAADRFRDVLAECLGHGDENPGDDVLVRELREHFGKTGPEPTRWRDFIAGALATIDQINADRNALDGTKDGAQ